MDGIKNKDQMGEQRMIHTLSNWAKKIKIDDLWFLSKKNVTIRKGKENKVTICALRPC